MPRELAEHQPVLQLSEQARFNYYNNWDCADWTTSEKSLRLWYHDGINDFVQYEKSPLDTIDQFHPAAFETETEQQVLWTMENNWEHIFNTERKYALYNIKKGIEHLNCDDDDVIVLLDGDDWFFDDEVLDKLAENYKDDIYLTYGQYISSAGTDTSIGYTFMPNESVIKNKTYRKIPWLFTHLKTFKYSRNAPIKIS